MTERILYRSIRTNLAFVTSQGQEQAVAITSSGPREGKTATSSNLAITFAQLGQKVLLIDADLRRPSVHSVFKLENNKGLSSLLIEATETEETIKQTDLANLHVITSGPTPPNPSELLSSPSFDRCLDRLRPHYDKIIFDACPTLMISDVLSLAQKVDGMIFVIRAEQPYRGVVSKAIGQLTNVGANLLGVILNGVHRDQQDPADRYYQQYGYGYYGYRPSSQSEESTTNL